MNMCLENLYNSLVNERNGYKPNGISHGDDEKVDFKCKFHFDSTFLMTNMVMNKIRKFCFEEGLECQLYKSGWILHRVDCVIKGTGTRTRAYQVKNAVNDYFQRLSAI